MKYFIFFFVLLKQLLCQDIDENGYIVYCPCMGRFGNQAEQLLGSLQFAKALNRTLVLPPFIEYNQYQVNFIPFDDYIQVEPIKKYHRVILMEQFMNEISPKVWPKNERFIFCYSKRMGSNENDCNPFEGNPFKPFWHHFDIIKFEGGSIFHAPLTTDYRQVNEWNAKYNHIKVLAFVGAPSTFPTNKEAVIIQQYINFSDKLAKIAKDYRETRKFARIPYLAIHLRHGSDWVKACNVIKENPHINELFSSQQCTSLYEQHEHSLDYELCYPPYKTIIKQINDIVILSHNPHKIETVYISTDTDNKSLWMQMHTNLPNITLIAPTITISSQGHTSDHSPPTPLIDAYLMTFANHFIGNCISSFSAFVSRIRIYNLHFNDSTSFFSEHKLLENLFSVKDEL